MRLSLKTTEAFFDRPKVIKAMKAGQRRALMRAGGLVRTTARRSIKKRKRVSDAGKPPSSHEGSLKRLIFFGYEASRETIVVGPLKFRRGVAPALLEAGGTVNVRDKLMFIGADAGGYFRDERGRFRSRTKGVRVTGALRYRPRPFMGPALASSRSKIPAAFRGSLEGR